MNMVPHHGTQVSVYTRQEATDDMNFLTLVCASGTKFGFLDVPSSWLWAVEFAWLWVLGKVGCLCIVDCGLWIGRVVG